MCVGLFYLCSRVSICTARQVVIEWSACAACLWYIRGPVPRPCSTPSQRRNPVPLRTPRVKQEIVQDLLKAMAKAMANAMRKPRVDEDVVLSMTYLNKDQLQYVMDTTPASCPNAYKSPSAAEAAGTHLLGGGTAAAASAAATAAAGTHRHRFARRRVCCSRRYLLRCCCNGRGPSWRLAPPGTRCVRRLTRRRTCRSRRCPVRWGCGTESLRR